MHELVWAWVEQTHSTRPDRQDIHLTVHPHVPCVVVVCLCCVGVCSTVTFFVGLVPLVSSVRPFDRCPTLTTVPNCFLCRHSLVAPSDAERRQYGTKKEPKHKQQHDKQRGNSEEESRGWNTMEFENESLKLSRAPQNFEIVNSLLCETFVACDMPGVACPIV